MSKKLKLIGGFELIAKIGQGAMGTVFKARQLSMERLVALKVLSPQLARERPDYIKRFFQEARVSAKLNHPNIVQGIEVGLDEPSGLYYFAMEFVDGPNIKDIVKKEFRIAEAKSIEIVYGIAQALRYANGMGIIHRDIKPENILLGSRGVPKLADLGLAKPAQEILCEEGVERSGTNTGDAALTQLGQAVGTPHYMAPEQAMGKNDRLDIRTDLYALGASLFHMLTGRTPYRGLNTQEILRQHVYAPVPDPRELEPALSSGVANLTMRLMQKSPRDRFQDPEEALMALETLLQGSGTKSSSTGILLRQRPSTQRQIPPLSSDKRLLTANNPPDTGEQSKAGVAFWRRHFPLLATAACLLLAVGVLLLALPQRKRRPVETTAPALTPQPVTQQFPQREIKSEEAIPALASAPIEVEHAPPLEIAHQGSAKTPEQQMDLATAESDPAISALTVPVQRVTAVDPWLKLLQEFRLRQEEALRARDLPRAIEQQVMFFSQQRLTEAEGELHWQWLNEALLRHGRSWEASLRAELELGDFNVVASSLQAIRWVQTERLPALRQITDALRPLRLEVDHLAVQEQQAPLKALGLEPGDALEMHRLRLMHRFCLLRAEALRPDLNKMLQEVARLDVLSPVYEELQLNLAALHWEEELDAHARAGLEKTREVPRFELNFEDGRPLAIGSATDSRLLGLEQDTIRIETQQRQAEMIVTRSFSKLTRDCKWALGLLSTPLNSPERSALQLRSLYLPLLNVYLAELPDRAQFKLLQDRYREAHKNNADPRYANVLEPWLERIERKFSNGESSRKALPERISIPLGEQVQLELKLIRAGSFTMGRLDGNSSVNRPYRVTLTNDYYLSTCEITQAQYYRIMQSLPSKVPGGNRPVESVNWGEANLFCNRLSQYMKYEVRLPTEAEWEYACRTGDDDVQEQRRLNDALNLGWHKQTAAGQAREVGTSRPNAWGLYDMRGNVWEWVLDWSGVYPVEPTENPTGPVTGRIKVTRGGGAASEPHHLRASFRNAVNPEDRDALRGFRVAIPLDREGNRLPTPKPLTNVAPIRR